METAPTIHRAEKSRGKADEICESVPERSKATAEIRYKRMGRAMTAEMTSNVIAHDG